MIWSGKVIQAALNPCRASLKSSFASAGVSRLPVPVASACIHTTSVHNAGGHWRKSQGLPSNPNAYGRLTDGPDYAFLDGKPTPPGTGKIRRAKEQREIATKIIELSGEVDFALDRYSKMQKEKQEYKANRIASKLKPKGDLPPEDIMK